MFGNNFDIIDIILSFVHNVQCQCQIYKILKSKIQCHYSVFFSSIKKEKRPPSPEDDDVIILSDNDSPCPPMNGLSHFKELDTDLLMVRQRHKSYGSCISSYALAMSFFLMFKHGHSTLVKVVNKLFLTLKDVSCA